MGTRARDDQAAQHRPKRDGHADRGAEGAERLRSLGPSERQLDGRGDGRVEDPGSNALDRAGGDDLALVLRQPASRAGQREDGQADEEQRLVTEPVAGPACWNQGEAVGERVGGDDPHQGGGRSVQAGPDRGQRDGHDRGVEQRHESADEHDGDRAPAVSVRRRDLPGSERAESAGSRGRYGAHDLVPPLAVVTAQTRSDINLRQA